MCDKSFKTPADLRVHMKVHGSDDEKYTQARAALKKYIETLFELAELSEYASSADAIIELETKLAKAQWTRTEMRNAEKQ